MPRFDTSFDFGANKPRKTAARPKAAKKSNGGKPKGRAYFKSTHGS
jgi:hypothetical protein